MTNGRARRTIAALSIALAVSALPATGAIAAGTAPPALTSGGRIPRSASGWLTAGAAQPRAGGLCSSGSCYYFASVGVLGASTTGVSAKFSQSRPKVGAQDRYSGAMVSVSSANGKQGLEFGWWVSKAAFNDTVPHLAFNAIVDDTPLCLNTCGFVPISKTPHGGSGVAIGKLGTYTIKLVKSRWVLVYNGTVIGYFPTSLWKGKLNRSQFEGAFGVVASSSPTAPHSQMGNGVVGTSSRSAKMVAFKLIHTVGKPQFSYGSDNAPSKYKVGLYKPGCTNSCNMHFGGPGF
jgi:hypothetical protein